uniref:Uncharacterized protein n=1 Tax=Ursus americanus TaxID=9643 RepID=A0A452QDA1_URSAM
LFKTAKKKNKKGKTISLTDFLAEDGGTGGGSTYVPKPVSWADETDDLEGDGNFFLISHHAWSFPSLQDQTHSIVMVHTCNLKGTYSFYRTLSLTFVYFIEF